MGCLLKIHVDQVTTYVKRHEASKPKKAWESERLSNCERHKKVLKCERESWWHMKLSVKNTKMFFEPKEFCVFDY